MTAPAAMPSVDQIIPLIQEVMGRDNYALALHTARKVDALFAPILAEKERQLTSFRQYVAMHRDRALAAEAERDAAIKTAEMNATSGAFWAERGKNAEAALAAERAMLKRIVDLHADWRLCMPKDWEGDPLSDACEDAAAAIRAQE